ncbi:MAG TPA: hypothetical protein VKE22_03380 [Haliangiales bacterium]|nr:hypothetical protein [Haliangiales bacterium]
MADAKKLIGAQVELIKKQDVDGLKKTFTARLADRITAENVKKAADQLKSYTLDDLVAAVETKGDSVKIKMKNGRSLTTLVKDGGAWKADTVWFK